MAGQLYHEAIYEGGKALQLVARLEHYGEPIGRFTPELRSNFKAALTDLRVSSISCNPSTLDAKDGFWIFLRWTVMTKIPR